jgi:hypothetical protein
MKHDRLTSEYDRVRKAAGLAKPVYEFPEEAQPAQIDHARVEAAHADFKSRMAEREAHEEKQRAETKKRVDELQVRANRSTMMREYQAAGVDPPYVDAEGNPKFSIGFLRKIGWAVVVMDGHNVMVSPVGREK